MIISPTGLFKRAILESGPAINPSWGRNTVEQGLAFGEMLKAALDCDNTDDELNCLQRKSFEEILYAMDLDYDNSPYSTPFIWQPVPDANFISDPFLPDNPEDLLKSGEFNTDIEVIIGTNSDEGLIGLLDAMTNSSLWNVYKVEKVMKLCN